MSARSPHRVRCTTICDGYPKDRLTFGLTEGRTRIRGSRQSASDFRVYTTTTRAGDAVHVVYALYQKGAISRVPFKVLKVWEVPADAVLDSFGLLADSTA